ncbi:hypothetical protein D3C86_1028240 [compost metagenome]
MKKRTFRKIKKLLPRVVMGVFALLLFVFSVYQSIDGFMKLHNGASYESVAGHKYSPVVTETLVLMVAGAIFLIGVKLLTKWNNLRITAIGVATYASIGLFAYWALQYTRQSVEYGLGTIAIITVAVVITGGLFLLYEAYVRKKRKQTRKRHPVVKLNDAIEKRKEYMCICGREDKIHLGLHWVRTVNIIWVTIFGLVLLVAVYDAALLTTVLFIALLIAGIVVFNYMQIYRDMMKYGHTPNCSLKCARVGI